MYCACPVFVVYHAKCACKGGEPFEAVSGRANRSNGFIKGSKVMADVQPTAGEMVSGVIVLLDYFISWHGTGGIH